MARIGAKPENGSSRSPPKDQLESNVEEPRAPSADPVPESKPDPVPPEPKPIVRAESPPPVVRASKTESKEIVPKERSPAPVEPPEQPAAATDPYRLALEPVPAATSTVTTLAPLAPIFERGEGAASLSSADRAAMVQFFDGASTRELLLESAAVLGVPELFTPDVLNGFPHAFNGRLSQEGVVNLMNVFSGFLGGGAPPARDLSAEVRQTIVINTRGQRVMRKTILVDGNICCSEEQVLA